MGNGLIDAIKGRQSIRKFDDRPVSDEMIGQILDCARFAPSGMNNQPWRFVIIKGRGTMAQLAECTKYGRILLGAPAALAVYLDNGSSYNHLKDVQSIGACCQTLLLAAHACGLGAVWIGEILNRSEAVNKILAAPEDHELMAVIALGWPAESPEPVGRLDLDDLIIGRL